MTKIFQQISVLLLKAISYLPFWFLYLLSDFFYAIIYYVIGYRKTVVIGNLRESFPEKNDAEIKKIAKGYYHHFCDITLESLKMHRLPPEKMKKHVVFTNPELADKYYDQNKGLIYLAAHYNNWEWNAWGAYFLKHEMLLVYSTLRSNKSMDDYMRNMRTQYGGRAVKMGDAAREGLRLDHGKRPKGMWLAADQSAPKNSHFWTPFLNHETCFFEGPQRIAYKSNSPVLFHYVHKVKRGQYVAHYFEINESPKESGEYDVLLDYVNVLEEIIKQKPEYWLWSHRRWKHKRDPEQKLTSRKPNEALCKEVRETIKKLNEIKDLSELKQNI